MIESLEIYNYILVDHIVITFDSGFTVLTGETGAGKSILVGALKILAGEKLSDAYIRPGKDEASFTAVWNIKNRRAVHAFLQDRGLSCDDEQLIVRRTIRVGGRPSSYIQSQQVTQKDLETLSALLVDQHSQHEHQSLFVSQVQRTLLDTYAGCVDAVGAITRSYHAVQKLHQDLQEHHEVLNKIVAEKEYLQHAMEEIEQAGLQSDEDRGLEEELNVLANSKDIEELCGQIGQLFEGEKGVTAGLGQVLRLIQLLSRKSTTFAALEERITAADIELRDIHSDFSDKVGRLIFDPAHLVRVEKRLGLIDLLKSKYGKTIDAILTFKVDAQKKLEHLDQSDEEIALLTRKLRDEEKKLFQLSKQVSLKRMQVAKKLTGEITEHLRLLGMPHAQLTVQADILKNANGTAQCGPYGIDEITFLFTANAGAQQTQLKRAASGGELSRIMLAIKSVFAYEDTIPTLIFDEVDAGIGGEIALRVAEHLKKLAETKQVLCITHLGSLATYADHHFKVSKTVQNNETFTEARLIEHEERITEVARMLSGNSDASESRNHAKSLLEKVHA